MDTKKKPLSFSTVIVMELKLRGTTDQNGRVDFKIPKPGFYTFRIITQNRIHDFRKEVLSNDSKITFWISATDDELIEKNRGIQVTGKKETATSSRIKFDRRELRGTAGTMGDSLKTVFTAPGLSEAKEIGARSTSSIPSIGASLVPVTTGEGTGSAVFEKKNSKQGFLSIRGAPTRSSRFYADGLSMEYPFHMGGGASVLNNEFIESAGLYSGSYSARYGDSIGGLLLVEGSNSESPENSTINSSLFLSDFSESRNFDDGAGHLFLGFRHSYENYVLSQIDLTPPTDQFSAYGLADYNDAQTKLSYSLAPGHRLEFLALHSRDYLTVRSGVSDLERELVAREFNRQFQTAGIRYQFIEGIFTNNLQIQTVRFKEVNQNVTTNPFTKENLWDYNAVDQRRTNRLNEDLRIEMIDSHLNLGLGGQIENRSMNLSIDNLNFGQNSLSETNPVDFFDARVRSDPRFRALVDGDETNFSLNGAYLELEMLYSGLMLQAGIREDHSSLSGETVLSPRLLAEYEIASSGTTFSLSAGKHHGLPTDLAEISSESGNPDLQMEESERMSAGISQRIFENWEVKVEGFRNIYRNLVVADDQIENPVNISYNWRRHVEEEGYFANLMNDPIHSKKLYFSNDGTGSSTGGEMFLRRRDTGERGISGWLSYSNSITKRNNHQHIQTEEERKATTADHGRLLSYSETRFGPIKYFKDGSLELNYDNDTEELYDYDRRHNLQLVLNYRINSEWRIGGRFQYVSNLPIVPITGSEELELEGQPYSLYTPVYSNAYNSDRLAPIHQLDIRLDRFLRYEWGSINPYIEFTNIYARKNQEMLNWNPLLPYIPGSNPGYYYHASVISPKRGSYFPRFNIGMEARF